ncbi:MAG: hypothetical protein LQ344_007979 [Seirophora lacunosa]|nr:MAG: hypothetical protein LQ344_007979 [Seirophora lacunosa]
MASVSSLDKDLRNMRLGKYTTEAANEARTWIEASIGERLAAGDLLDALRDGIALCKLANLATGPPGVRCKESSMPFVQMENISHFLRACKSPPLNLQAHDIFQTVDLFEHKDPAQVLTCIGAFSRRANALQPSKFPTMIGPRSKAGPMSPDHTGGYGSNATSYGRPRGASNTSATSSAASTATSRAGGRISPSRFSNSTASSVNGGTKSPTGGVSSWSKRTDEGATTPAWNIHQYGYMGGASQGNQGITFGGRRQITTPAPKVPSFAEKERKRREEEAEAERLRQQAEEAEQKRRAEREAEEERGKIAEENRWAEETRRQREVEKQRIEEEKRRWDDEERKWKEEEEARAREEQEAELQLAKERQQKRAQSDARLTGQFLSQYQASQRKLPIPPTSGEPPQTPEAKRVEELERELEKAKEREAQYERERRERMRQDRHEFGNVDSALQRERGRDDSPPKETGSIHDGNDESWLVDEREYLQREWVSHQSKPPTSRTQTMEAAPPKPPRPLPTPMARAESPPPPPQPPRPLPTPQASTNPPPIQEPPTPTPSPPPSLATRPLPPTNPTSSSTTTTSPTKPPRSPFARPPPSNTNSARTSSPSPFQPTSSTTKPPSSSLLDREMELERQRQREWEEAQKSTRAAAAASGRTKDDGFGPKGESWDVHQYGYLGGDSQNRGGPGLGGRRQLVGPRSMGK